MTIRARGMSMRQCSAEAFALRKRGDRPLTNLEAADACHAAVLVPRRGGHMIR
jgi:hypothetical protein